MTNFIGQALRDEPITVYGDGSQTRSFCYVTDQIRGQRALLESDYTGPVNIGNDTEITIGELAETIVRLTGSSSKVTYEPLPAGDPVRRRPDLTLARDLLGFQPEVDVEHGIAETIDYFVGLLRA
jgi:nucleoside-diphosphate-sugar epimerase